MAGRFATDCWSARCAGPIWICCADRHPIVVFFVDCPPDEIDVDVHPAKAEVRVSRYALVRGLILGGLAQRARRSRPSRLNDGRRRRGGWASAGPTRAGTAAVSPQARGNSCFHRPRRRSRWPKPATAFCGQIEEDPAAAPPRRNPRRRRSVWARRTDGTDILAETTNGIVLVDQHAAHERLVYEKMKEALAARGVARQTLLLPEVVELDEAAASRLAARAAGSRPSAWRPSPSGRLSLSCARSRRCCRGSMSWPWCAISPTNSPNGAMRWL